MNWKGIFEEFKKNYVRIFDVIYPAKNSTGFPERNLSVNFAKAYEKLFENSNTWYELQFGIKNNRHIDAVIIDSKNKNILLIESKRFNNPSKKINEIKTDIFRIIDLKKELSNDQDNRIKNIKLYQFYGVVLADVWIETQFKKEIFVAYRDQTYIKDKYPDINLKGLYYDIREFNSIDNYKLLSFVWELD